MILSAKLHKRVAAVRFQTAIPFTPVIDKANRDIFGPHRSKVLLDSDPADTREFYLQKLGASILCA